MANKYVYIVGIVTCFIGAAFGVAYAYSAISYNPLVVANYKILIPLSILNNVITFVATLWLFKEKKYNLLFVGVSISFLIYLGTFGYLFLLVIEAITALPWLIHLLEYIILVVNICYGLSIIFSESGKNRELKFYGTLVLIVSTLLIVTKLTEYHYYSYIRFLEALIPLALIFVFYGQLRKRSLLQQEEILDN